MLFPFCLYGLVQAQLAAKPHSAAHTTATRTIPPHCLVKWKGEVGGK